MKQLPPPEVYEKEFTFMPWGKLVEAVLNEIEQKADKGAKILDLMCGPGYLLGKIKQRRPDLELFGVDIDKRYIDHANKIYESIDFIESDSLKWKTNEKFDIIICTAGLHHLPYEKQEIFVKKISSLLKEEGFCIIADPYIDDYSN